MKKLILIAALALPLAAQQTSPPAKQQKTGAKPRSATKKAKKPAVPPQPSGLPKDAVKLNEMEYRWLDPKGVAWIYRQGPVGFSRYPEAQPPMPASAAQPPELFEAVDRGDSVEFTKPGPVGVSKWTKKKTELTPVEQASWDAAQARLPVKQ